MHGSPVTAGQNT